METKIITKEDIDKDNFYKHSDSLEYEGHLELEANLGRVKFKAKIKTTGFIFAKAGTGIEAGEGIVTFLYGIAAKWISCLRIAIGFNSKTEQELKAKIRKGQLILGKNVK